MRDRQERDEGGRRQAAAGGGGGGLDGVVASETVMSDVDGEGGRLILRGHELRALVAARPGLEGVAALLWDGFAPEGGDAGAVQAGLAAGRQAGFALVPALLAAAAPELSTVEALRVGLGLLPDRHPLPAHLLGVGALAPFTAALLRRRQGLAPVPPQADLTQAADFLRMLRGEPASAAEALALDTYLVSVADHGLNASTFAARVVASTAAGMISSLLAGLCALKGPLHGGAPGPVLDLLDACQKAPDIVSVLQAELAAGRRLMGFGHRIYRVRDPRADVLKQVAQSLKGFDNRIRFAERVEREALALLAQKQPHRRLDTNVEFYTALTLEALALPREAFTAIFALGRAVGWSAHVLEQEKHGRILRPQSRYVGPRPQEAA